MGDSPRSNSPSRNFHKILGISNNSSLKDISKAYKSLVMKWHPDKHANNRQEAEAKFRDINEAYKVLADRKREEMRHEIDVTSSPDNSSSQPKSPDESFMSKFRSRTPTRFPTFSRNMSRTSTTPISPASVAASAAEAAALDRAEAAALKEMALREAVKKQTAMWSNNAALSRKMSRRAPTPIVFSGSTSGPRRKPPPIEKKMMCTLEDLLLGTQKKIKITRETLSEFGLYVQKDEILKVNIKPGWKKGTKITFEEKGDERPGYLPADIVFTIAEKRHPIFKRDGDNLELGVEVPLLNALIGCTISVPLLGGNTMNIDIDDIIHPGFEKLIRDQGMPKPRERGQRGDLRLKFFINFPTNLSDDQRAEIASILSDCSW